MGCESHKQRVGAMNPRVPIIWAPGEGEKRSFFGGGLHTWKLTTDDTDGAFFMLEDAMEQGKSTPLHRHPEADDVARIQASAKENPRGIEILGPSPFGAVKTR